MASITPFGKPLSKNPVVGANVPLSSAAPPASPQTVTPFQWLSLARATWTWILRPLWYLCFKWPTKLLIPTISDSSDARRRRLAEADDSWRRQQEDEEIRRAQVAAQEESYRQIRNDRLGF